MKSKLFVFAAIFAIALVVGITKAQAFTPGIEVPIDVDITETIPAHLTEDVHIDPTVLHPEFERIRHRPIDIPIEPTMGDPLADTDHDGVSDVMDNCIDDPNPDQLDIDGDGFGDVCDADIDGDDLLNDDDVCPEDFSEADDGCPVDGDLLIGGSEIPAPIDSEDDLADVEAFNAGGACTLVSNSGTSSILSTLVLALSMAPIAIRRSRIKK